MLTAMTATSGKKRQICERGGAYPPQGKRKKIRGQFRFNSRNYHVGYFDNLQDCVDAVQAAKAAKIAEHGGRIKPGPKPKG